MKKKDYEIGYKKPPKHTQFKPGQSGNPKGRPKKPQTIEDAAIQTLKQKIKIKNKDGEYENIEAFIALAQRIVFDALKGDKLALRFCMRYLWDKPIGEVKNTNKAQTVDDKKREELEKYVKELLYERTAGKKEQEQG